MGIYSELLFSSSTEPLTYTPITLKCKIPSSLQHWVLARIG